MAITFPNSPSSGDTHTTSNGLQYTYDGEKWTTIGTNSAGTWTRTGTTVSLTTAGDDLNVNSNTLFVDASTNRVGVGTTSVSSNLDVRGSGAVYSNVGSTNASGAYLFLDGNSNGDAGGGDYAQVAHLGGGELQINNLQAQPVTFRTGNTERLRIDSSGNVGIGTTSPQHRLSVERDVGIYRASSDPTLSLSVGGTIASPTKTYNLLIDDSDSDKLQIRDGSTARVTLDSSGNVGIGTTSPSTILHVEKDTSSGAVGTYPEIRLDNDEAFGRSELSFYDGATKRYGLFCYNGDGALRFLNSTGETARMDSSGRLLVGLSSSSMGCNVESGTTGGNNFAAGRFAANTGGPDIVLRKSRNATVGSHTIVQNGDDLGNIFWGGSNGSAFKNAARITAQVDATPGTGDDMPGRLVFATSADGSSSPTEALRIDQYQQLKTVPTYNNTSALAANVGVASTGVLYRSTSSAKYKTNIETIEDSYSDALLSCRPVWYKSICNLDNPDFGWWGFIAEEIAEIDPRLVHWKTTEVTYDENGSAVESPCDPEPEGVAYDRFVPHLVNLLKRQKEQIETLEQRLTDAGIA